MSSSERIRSAIRAASTGLVARERLVELVVLAAVAREHLLIIGPPGTAKSEAVRRISAVLGAQRFEYLLGRFAEPSELFGKVPPGGRVHWAWPVSATGCISGRCVRPTAT